MKNGKGIRTETDSMGAIEVPDVTTGARRPNDR